ncbi:MAG: amidohydrolase family protein [Betaproteobacteria bacterium]
MLISGAANADNQPARSDMSIVVDGEKISAVLPTSQVDAAITKNAEVIDARGMFAIPGLVDSHVHYATLPDRAYAEAELKRAIYGGLTGVRDMAGDARALADLSRAALVNEIASPDIFYASLVAGPGFFEDPRTVSSSLGMTPGMVPWLYAVTDKSDLARVVAQARGTGATGLKIYADLPGPIVKGLIAESKRQGFPVWTHQQVFPATPYDSLGATTVSHACMIARHIREPGKTQYKRSPHPSYAGMTADDPGIRKYVAALVASGTIMDATLSVYKLPPSTDGSPVVPKQCPIELVGDITRAMHKAGVKIIAGTDSGAVPDDPFPALYAEMEALVRYASMTPHEAIIAATRNAAAAVGKEKEFGTIEPGKFANFVLLKEDPTTDITKLRSVFMTVKRGTRFLRSAYQHRTIVEPSDL